MTKLERIKKIEWLYSHYFWYEHKEALIKLRLIENMLCYEKGVL